MFHAELISTSVIDPRFHGLAEILTGMNPATVVQRNGRPRSAFAHILAYFKAFSDPESDTSQVKALLPLFHMTMICAASEMDMADITGSPHGLTCLSCPITRRGTVGTLFSGDGARWLTALSSAGSGNLATQRWGMACLQQLAKHNLDDLFGRIKLTSGTQYLLEN